MLHKMLAPDNMGMVCKGQKVLVKEVPTYYDLDSSIIISLEETNVN